MALSGYQRKAIEALLIQPSVTAAADRAGLNRNTIYNYLKDEEFKAALAKAESERLAHLARNAATYSHKALLTLIKILDSPESTNSEKIRAARVILTALPNIRLLGSVEARLMELERLNRESK